MNYMEKIRENINGKLLNDFKFIIEFNSIENTYNNSIKNIKSKFILDYQDINGNKIYEDDNILIKGIGKGFEIFLNDLKFMDSLYKENIYDIMQNSLELYHIETKYNIENIIQPSDLREKRDYLLENKTKLIHQKYSIDNLRLKSIILFENEVLHFINEAISKNIKQFDIIIDNKIFKENKLLNYKLKEPYNLKQLLSKKLKDIFSEEITIKSFPKNYNKILIDKLYEIDNERKIINILEITLLECIKYYRKDSELLKNDYYNCLKGLEENFDNLKNKLRIQNYDDNFDLPKEKIKVKNKENKNIIKYINNIEHRNKINLIYEKKEEYKYMERIFGSTFVKNNKDNIKLIINGRESKLIEEYNLKKGENNIQLIILNKLTNLEGMFQGSCSLKNFEELKYLNIKEINNFSRMFNNCKSLIDIK